MDSYYWLLAASQIKTRWGLSGLNEKPSEKDAEEEEKEKEREVKSTNTVSSLCFIVILVQILGVSNHPY